MTPDPTPTDSTDRSRPPFDRTELDCADHAAALESLLETSRVATTPAATAPDAFAAHRAKCVGCADAWRHAQAVESVVPRWRAPEPPVGFRERALAAALALGESRSCRLFLSRLDAWRAGDLPAETAAAAEAHHKECVDCAAEAQVASQVDSLLRAASAPFPSPSFRARILHSLGVAAISGVTSGATSGAMSGATSRVTSGANRGGHAQSRSSFVALGSRRPARVARLLAAAGVLVTATLGFLAVPTDVSGVGGPNPTAADVVLAPTNPATDRADLARTASNEARRDSVGAFASSPRHIDRFARSGGNRLHKSIQRAMLESVAADPIPTNSGRTAR